MKTFSLSPGALLIAAALAITTVSGCGHEAPPTPMLKAVRTTTVGALESATTRAYPGEVKARFETLLGFRVPGKVVRRLVDVGAVVKRGQALAQLDSSDFALQVAQADAQAQLADAELKRYQDLRSKNFVSQAALDARLATATSAQAQAKITRNQAGYTTLTADRDGVVAAIFTEAGQVVAAGQPILLLAPDGDREVVISLPESEVSRMAKGTPATVALWSQGEQAQAIPGKLREISSAADPVTRTYAARVALPEAPVRLPVGLSATVRLTTGVPNASFTIPLSAVFQSANQMAVWKVGADGTVALAPISVNRYAGDQAIVTRGLNAGDRIVTAGVTLLANGQKVRVTTPPGQAAVNPENLPEKTQTKPAASAPLNATAPAASALAKPSTATAVE